VSEWLTFQAICSAAICHHGLEISFVPRSELCWRCRRPCAACFVKAFRRDFLGRARTPAQAAAKETDTNSLAAMFFLAALCLVAGNPAGLLIDALAPVAKSLVGVSMPHQAGVEWLSIVPIAEKPQLPITDCSCFIFIVFSGTLRSHRHSSAGLRQIAPRPGLDCGYPDPSPATAIYRLEFRASRSARVYGTSVFRAREIGEIARARLDLAGALTVELRDLSGRAYAPVATGIGYAAEKAQFPAIPHDPPISLAGVRGAGHSPAGARDMAVMIRDFALQRRADAAGCCAQPAAHRFRAQDEGRLLQRQGPPLLQPISI